MLFRSEPDASSYNLQISQDESFDSIIKDIETTKTLYIEKNEIDWDSNYCIHDENLESNEDEIEYEKYTIYCINLIFMSLHFLRYSHYNIFIGLNLDKGTIKRIQKYICNDDAKYRTIYKLFLKDYFQGNYNNGDIKKCKDIVSNLIT